MILVDMKKQEQKTVYVGMSGGVDSSVAALLLKKQGYNVVGVFMKNWSNTKDLKGECNWVAERQDAMRVAAKLDIPFKTYDFEKEYKEKVLKYFIKEYKAGRTPNPDIMCNKDVKFKLFLERALREGADFIATGHYANKRQETGDKRRVFKLIIPKDKDKDQTYFLYVLDQKILKKTLFPLGDLTKKEVREIAKKNELITAEKKDSVGICFVGEVDIKDFLKRYIKFTPGNIVDTKGKVLGQHQGLEPFTIGQRRGIEIGGTGPYYVVEKNFKTGDLVVTRNPKDLLLYKKELLVKKMHWISGHEPKLPIKVKARVRYRQNLETAEIKKTKQGYKVMFKKPERAITPGQCLVVYQGKECLGGGIIVT